LEWTRTTTPLGTGPQPAAYTIPPRGQTYSLITYKILSRTCLLVNPLSSLLLQPNARCCTHSQSKLHVHIGLPSIDQKLNYRRAFSRLLHFGSLMQLCLNLVELMVQEGYNQLIKYVQP